MTAARVSSRKLKGLGANGQCNDRARCLARRQETEMKKFVLIFTIFGLGLIPAISQAQGPGQMRAGENVVGKVTAVAKDSVTVAPLKGGDPVIVKTGDSTRIFKERQLIKLSEIKVDDTVFARGPLNGNAMDAVILGVVNPEMAERIAQGGSFGMGAGAGGQFKPEDWGKTFIAGQVKAIKETTLTIARPNNQQTLDIEVDENTSFKKGRESITLADIKPDDFVFGAGEIKNGVFVPKELRVGGGRMFMIGGGGPGPDQKKPDADKPPAAPKN